MFGSEPTEPTDNSQNPRPVNAIESWIRVNYGTLSIGVLWRVSYYSPTSYIVRVTHHRLLKRSLSASCSLVTFTFRIVARRSVRRCRSKCHTRRRKTFSRDSSVDIYSNWNAWKKKVCPIDSRLYAATQFYDGVQWNCSYDRYINKSALHISYI